MVPSYSDLEKILNKSTGKFLASKCMGKEVATIYFLSGDLKLNLSWLGFPK